MKPVIDRRRFMHTSARTGAALGIASGLLYNHSHAFAASEQSKVAVIRNSKAISDRNTCNLSEARRSIDRGLSEITGKTNPREIWTALGVHTDDVVGVKVNCNGARFHLHAHPELVFALCDSLTSVVPSNNIIIYERYSQELTKAGFDLNDSENGIRYKGTENDGFHGQENLSRIITDSCTKLINFPSLKTFEGEFAGTLFMKNHIGSLPPSHMPRCHGNAEMCTEVNARDTIRTKTVLGICDGLCGTYTGSKPWYFGGIIMSTDIVAAEHTALSVINEKRRDEKVAELRVPDYVRLADTKYKLGTVDTSRIRISNIQL